MSGCGARTAAGSYQAHPEEDAKYRLGRHRPWAQFIDRIRRAVFYLNRVNQSSGRKWHGTPNFNTPDNKPSYFGQAGNGARITRIS